VNYFLVANEGSDILKLLEAEAAFKFFLVSQVLSLLEKMKVD